MTPVHRSEPFGPIDAVDACSCSSCLHRAVRRVSGDRVFWDRKLPIALRHHFEQASVFHYRLANKVWWGIAGEIYH